ncbi:indolepyruvate oxidoreductase subunit beta family protein [Caulobacter sp. S45]|uniref:indolepyruvate oxidoreductase subunit beta family protein n=1 Tax=Caulobacter sp. S45 TaxID=1641861 RepID=UPI00131B906C|nr:indolepyruvate oxidoreductase subunit beta family protein [Caulobacter sp. S45]
MTELQITPRSKPKIRPITIAITAIGGQGGGVLADWIVSLAGAEGYIAQYTSVAGVAQRTGATIYYIELFPRAAAEAEGAMPVMALMPVIGDVDVVMAAELMEAGRALVRGLVTSDRTTLIASSHRIYGVTEKTAMGDGIAKSEKVIEAAVKRAKRLVLFDMAELAEQNGSVISAVMFGALAGADVLPFPPSAYEAAIQRGGIGVKASLVAFRAGLARAQAGAPALEAIAEAGPAEVTTAAGGRLVSRIAQAFPPTLAPILLEGVRRLADYQSHAYAEDYLDRLEGVLAADLAAGGAQKAYLLTEEAARGLALWMSYEDTIRVADLKTRASRFTRVRAEVKAAQDQLVYTSEFMHPRLEEVCDTLPAGLGAWILRTPWISKTLEPMFASGRKIATAKLGGFLTLYAVAALRPMRPSTLRFKREMAAMSVWLERVKAAAPRDYALGVELALCQSLVKGYGDTHARGMRSFEAIMAQADAETITPERVARLRAAALADEAGKTLTAELGLAG